MFCVALPAWTFSPTLSRAEESVLNCIPFVPENRQHVYAMAKKKMYTIQIKDFHCVCNSHTNIKILKTRARTVLYSPVLWIIINIQDYSNKL